MVMETNHLIDALSTRMDEAGISRIMASPVTEVISKHVGVLSGEPQDIVSSLGIVLELLTSGLDNIQILIMIPFLLVIIPQPARKLLAMTSFLDRSLALMP